MMIQRSNLTWFVSLFLMFNMTAVCNIISSLLHFINYRWYDIITLNMGNRRGLYIQRKI